MRKTMQKAISILLGLTFMVSTYCGNVYAIKCNVL